MSDHRGTYIERSVEDLSEMLAARPADWVVSFLRIAAHRGEAVAARSLGEPSTPGPRSVSVELLDSIGSDDEHVVAFRWRIAGFRWVPASFAGRIVLQRLNDGATEVSLEGSYAVPDAAGGRPAADAASVAVEATIATFLSSLRVAAEEQARSGV